MKAEPLTTPKSDFDHIIDRISVPNSPVGIDAQYTHAIIIEYLRQITARLEKIESQLGAAK